MDGRSGAELPERAQQNIPVPEIPGKVPRPGIPDYRAPEPESGPGIVSGFGIRGSSGSGWWSRKRMRASHFRAS